MRKKVDPKIQTLIDNCIKLRQRGFFVMIGDKGKDQVVNIHYLLTKNALKMKPKVLWCYKKELGFSSHKKKRMKEIQALQKKGLYDNNVDDPFELFITSTEIRYCYYKETHKVLGNTFNLLILQDFEAVTPNILCRTVETIEGGGLVILLIKTMASLKQLYTITMDVHSRFRTEQFQDVQPRFNERFILSLSQCKNCIVMDDELNILPICTLVNDIQPVLAEDSLDLKQQKDLIALKDSLKENNLVGPLVKICKTLDQAKAVMTFIDAITEKNCRYTISMTAGRGRGKSSAMGMSIAAAIACGFSNIFITAPSPENLNTLFEFIFSGLESLQYKENQHYEIIQSTNPEFNNAIIRVNIYKTHRQIIQYISPLDYKQIGQADLLVIDEAASIPLIYVKKLLGPYLVFLSSTVNGYEGTGRSLSLKLIQQLKEQNQINKDQFKSNKSGTGSRMLKEITLQDPIRYAFNDPIEKWLNDLLLLEATQAVPLKSGLPHPNDCELYLVNKDTLFSYKPSTEKFLFNLMSLFISSHYKNSPNDLQLLSDAPAHQIFVLIENLANKTKSDSKDKKADFPDILCAVQVAIEGKISKQSITSQNERAFKPSGDLIPWTIGEQYQDSDFPQLSGARVVRIATHPAAQKMGYGSKALQLLQKFFEGELVNLSNSEIQLEEFFEQQQPVVNESDQTTLQKSQELEEQKKQQNQQLELTKKRVYKPILKKLTEIKPPLLHYLGVSYGLTKPLFKFWKKNNYAPLYLRQVKNDLTAEHTCIMLKVLKNQDKDEEMQQEKIGNKNWLEGFQKDFKKRFINLLSYEFKDLEVGLSLEIVDPSFILAQSNQDQSEIQLEQIQADKNLLQKNIVELFLNPFDLKRLDAYARNLADFHIIMDLLPSISFLFFDQKLQNFRMSYSQCAILVGMGLQHKDVDQVSGELNIPVSQILALFNKAVRKFNNYFKKIYEEEIEKSFDQQKGQKGKQSQQLEKLQPIKTNIEQEVQDEGEKYIQQIENKNLQESSDQPLKKKKHKKQGKYNYELDDIDESQIKQNIATTTTQEQLLGKQSATIIIPRKMENAYNQDFLQKKIKISKQQ